MFEDVGSWILLRASKHCIHNWGRFITGIPRSMWTQQGSMDQYEIQHLPPDWLNIHCGYLPFPISPHYPSKHSSLIMRLEFRITLFWCVPPMLRTSWCALGPPTHTEGDYTNQHKLMKLINHRVWWQFSRLSVLMKISNASFRQFVLISCCAVGFL